MNSVDVKCHKHNLKLILISSVICEAIVIVGIGACLLVYPQTNHIYYWVNTLLFLALSIIVDATEVYFTYSKINHLVENCDRYIFTNSVLSSSHNTPSGMVFKVKVHNSKMENVFVDTQQTFGFYREPYFENYNNKKVEIAYDDTTGRVVIVSLL